MDDEAWWRCAYFAYLDSEEADHADEDDARKRSAEVLAATVEGFVERKLNFGTLKYRMDNASIESGSVFPSRSVCSVLSDLALGVPIDDLEPMLRKATPLPQDPGEAKGALMDLDEAIEREVGSGHLRRQQAQPERWVELMACLWHIQDRGGWPLPHPGALRYLSGKGEIDPVDPLQGYAEYTGFLRHLAETTGGGMAQLEHLLSALGEDRVEVPSLDACFDRAMARAREMDKEGQADGALMMYERALSLHPATPEALMRKAALYEGKGLIMAAIGELEVLVEISPADLPAHRKLIELYKSRKMVREHNIEVRRFRAVMGK